MRQLAILILSLILASAALAQGVWPGAPSSGVNTDFTVATPPDGGNQNDFNQFVGVPRIVAFLDAALPTNSQTTTGFIDADPAADWTDTTNVTATTSTGFYRGYPYAGSLKAVIVDAAAATEGVDTDLTFDDNQDWQSDESFGLWMYCTIAFPTLGDWDLEIVDNTMTSLVDFPALTQANQWQWLEVDISTVAATGTNVDVITDIGFHLSAAGAALVTETVTCYFANAGKWDAGSEIELGADILPDGVIGVFAMLNAGGEAPDMLVEGTDFFVHYQSGNDTLVVMTNQNVHSGWGYVAVAP